MSRHQPFVLRGDGLEVRPSGGFANCPAFDPRNTVSTRLRAACEATMPGLYFGSARLPTWEQICDRVNEQRTLL